VSERHVHLPPESSGQAPPRGRLTGRRILVVGGGQTDIGEDETPVGNGRAMSILFAREGARVAVADRVQASAEATVALMPGGQGTAIAADVTDPAAIEAMVARATDALGGLDGLVLNVGIGGKPTLAENDAAAWDFTFSVNLRSHMLSVRAAWPHLANASSIVFISSIAGIKPGSRIPAYDASKAALGGLCRHVALEGEKRAIRANVVAPGLMDTSIGRLASRGRPSRTTTPVPLSRQGTGWETAYAALFLISDEAAYVTGQTLVVDGGLSALR
jgi:NAD(P)-dependent dehydrogenase (short-subunit alcohol dehydrogenase family)